MDAPLLEVRDLVKHFPAGRSLFGPNEVVHAVDGVSFDIARGETLALVGESGCGKSTVGRCLLGLVPPTSGQIRLAGHRVDTARGAALRAIRRRIGAVFQDPFSSLNPRLRVRDSIAEPIRNHGLARDRGDVEARVARLLDLVRLPRDAGERLPHEFSGGQRQRICIARALAGEPVLLICDEAVSALDVSVKAQIVNLLDDLRRDLGLAMLFISHDLAIVEHITDRVAVMYLGRTVETGTKRALFGAPSHPYTRALLSAVPVPDPAARRKREVLTGDVPSPISPPTGCRFRTRCPSAFARCATETPALKTLAHDHRAACHLVEAG